MISLYNLFEVKRQKTPILEKDIESKSYRSKHGVSMGRDKDGFFVNTHRCRSKSYPTKNIPKSVIKRIERTG